MKKIDSMTEEEFTKAALEKGFDEHWIKSCINDCKKDIEKILKEGLIEPIPLERNLALNTKRNPQALPVVRQCVLHGQ